MTDLLVEFEELCKNHDWWYAMSDDHRVWTRGTEERDALIAKLQECRNAGLTEESNEIWERYRP